jgi:hypothetical protein
MHPGHGMDGFGTPEARRVVVNGSLPVVWNQHPFCRE